MLRRGDVVPGQNSHHTRRVLGRGEVQVTNDPFVDRAVQNLDVQHAGKHKVVHELGPARYLPDALVTGR